MPSFVAPRLLMSFPWRVSRRNRNAVRLCASTATLELGKKNTRPRSEARNRDVTKKKVALIVGYNGANYHGLQRNANVETVSDVLERALHAAGAISDDNFGSLEKIKWQVSARTDRGVSAAGNVVSGKFLFPRDFPCTGVAFDSMTERINNHLPQDVRIFGMKNVTSSFSARTSCGERWYEYLLPLEALKAPQSLEKFRDLMALYEGTHWFHNFTIGANHTVPPTAQSSRFITEAVCGLSTVHMSSTTNSSEASDKSSWIRVQVKGQSFMLHQIRKMISLAILTHNRDAPADAIERSFQRETVVNIPPAPAAGLFLDCCHFKWYNERHKAALQEPVTCNDFNDAREEFKKKYIFPSIARRMAEEDAVGVYLRTADIHPVLFSPS